MSKRLDNIQKRIFQLESIIESYKITLNTSQRFNDKDYDKLIEERKKYKLQLRYLNKQYKLLQKIESIKNRIDDKRMEM